MLIGEAEADRNMVCEQCHSHIYVGQKCYMDATTPYVDAQKFCSKSCCNKYFAARRAQDDADAARNRSRKNPIKMICTVWYVLTGWMVWVIKVIPGGSLITPLLRIFTLEFASYTKCYHLKNT